MKEIDMWLRLTDANEKTIMVNSDHVVWFRAGSDDFAELHVTYYGGDRNITIQVKQTAEHIADLLTGQPT
jgi:hypothetical protein